MSKYLGTFLARYIDDQVWFRVSEDYYYFWISNTEAREFLRVEFGKKNFEQEEIHKYLLYPDAGQ